MALLTKGEQWWDRGHWVVCAPSDKWWVQWSVWSFPAPFHQLRFRSNCYYTEKPSIPGPGAEMKSNCFNYPRSAQVINTNTTQVGLRLLNSSELYVRFPTVGKWGKHQHKTKFNCEPVITPLLGRCWVLIRFRSDGLERSGGILSSFTIHPYLAFHSIWHSRIIGDEQNPNENPFQPLQEQKANVRIKEKQARRQVGHGDHRSLETAFLVIKSLSAPRGWDPLKWGSRVITEPGASAGGESSQASQGNSAMQVLPKGSWPQETPSAQLSTKAQHQRHSFGFPRYTQERVGENTKLLNFPLQPPTPFHHRYHRC